MRKRIDPPLSVHSTLPGHNWLDLESLAQVELSSEDKTHPLENAWVIELQRAGVRDYRNR